MHTVYIPAEGFMLFQWFTVGGANVVGKILQASKHGYIKKCTQQKMALQMFYEEIYSTCLFNLRDKKKIYLLFTITLHRLHLIKEDSVFLIAADLPLCRPTVPVCGRYGGTLCTGLLTLALTSAFGRNSQTGDSCPVLAQQCWAPGSPRGPGRPARLLSRCLSVWNEPVCNTGSHDRPTAIQSHKVLHATAFLKISLFFFQQLHVPILPEIVMLSLQSLLLTCLW